MTWNEEEEDRLEGLQIAKLRGKGAPKKKRTADGEFTCIILSLNGVVVKKARLLTVVANSEQEREEEKEVTHEYGASYCKCKYNCIGGVLGIFESLYGAILGLRIHFLWKLYFFTTLPASEYPHSRSSYPPAIRAFTRKPHTRTAFFDGMSSFPHTSLATSISLSQPSHLILEFPNPFTHLFHRQPPY